MRMKNIFKNVMNALLPLALSSTLLVATSCSKEKNIVEPQKSDPKEEFVSPPVTDEDMTLILKDFNTLNAKYGLEDNLSKKIFDRNAFLSGDPELQRGFLGWLKKFFGKTAVVVSDIAGGAVGGAVGGAGGAVIGFVGASAGAAAIVGAKVSFGVDKINGQPAGKGIVTFSTRGKLEYEPDDIPAEKLGVIHNEIISKAISLNGNFLKQSERLQFAELRREVAKKLNLNEDNLPTYDQMKFCHKEIVTVLEGEYSSDRELIEALSKVIGKSYSETEFILNYAVNSISILENKKSLTPYIQDVSDLIESSNLTNRQKIGLISSLSVGANSAALWIVAGDN